MRYAAAALRPAVLMPLMTDIYHTYLTLAALALGKETPELAALDATLNVEEGVSRLIRTSLASNAPPLPR